MSNKTVNKLPSTITAYFVETFRETLKQLATESVQNGDWRKLGAISTIAIALESLEKGGLNSETIDRLADRE